MRSLQLNPSSQEASNHEVYSFHYSPLRFTIFRKFWLRVKATHLKFWVLIRSTEFHVFVLTWQYIEKLQKRTSCWRIVVSIDLQRSWEGVWWKRKPCGYQCCHPVFGTRSFFCFMRHYFRAFLTLDEMKKMTVVRSSYKYVSVRCVSSEAFRLFIWIVGGSRSRPHNFSVLQIMFWWPLTKTKSVSPSGGTPHFMQWVNKETISAYNACVIHYHFWTASNRLRASVTTIYLMNL